MDTDSVSKTVWSHCLAAKQGEKALIVFDKKTKWAADSLLAAGEKFCSVEMAETRKSKMHGQEPEQRIAKLMMGKDIIIAPTFYSLTHTKAIHKARKVGNARVITMPGITNDIYLRAILIDYKEMDSYAQKILSEWKNKKSLTIETKAGTDLFIVIGGRKMDIDSGLCLQKGNLYNLPAGEVEVSPLEGKSEGKIVVDLTHPLKGKVKRPFKIWIESGEMVDCTDKQLWKLCSETENGTNLAEFAVGTNPKAKIRGNVLEDEKVRGTAHAAFGTSTALGGLVQSSIHLDCVFDKPTISFDGEIILKYGKLVKK